MPKDPIATALLEAEAVADALEVAESNLKTVAVTTGAAVVLKEVLWKRWITMGDDRVRPAHADANGQEVPFDEPFIVDGEELMFPGDPSGSPENTYNCRCIREEFLKVVGGDATEADEVDLIKIIQSLGLS